MSLLQESEDGEVEEAEHYNVIQQVVLTLAIT